MTSVAGKAGLMSFAVRPPEIISGQMYTGPGAGPMIAAATAWDALATELQSTAASYGLVIDGLANESWTGPSSAAMAAAAAPYVTWMSATGAQAKAAADQAKAAASAYEAAFAAVVPPAQIAINRTQLAMLVATNIFGQNTGAIAALEAQYGEMWAQDTAAMFGYANSSAAAARLTPYTEPPQVTNASGLANQQAAVGQAGGLAAGTAAATAAATAAPVFPFDIVLQILQGLGSAGTSYMQFMGQILNTLTGTPLAASTWENTFGILADIGRFSTVANDTMSGPNLGMTEFKIFWKPPIEDIPEVSAGSRAGDGADSRPEQPEQHGIGGRGRGQRGGQVVGATELGIGHSGDQDGFNRDTGHQPGRGARGRDAGEPAQPSGAGEHDRWRHGHRRRSSPQWKRRPGPRQRR